MATALPVTVSGYGTGYFPLKYLKDLRYLKDCALPCCTMNVLVQDQADAMQHESILIPQLAIGNNTPVMSVVYSDSLWGI